MKIFEVLLQYCSTSTESIDEERSGGNELSSCCLCAASSSQRA